MSQFLIWVNVTVDRFGHPSYRYRINAGAADGRNLAMHMGDQVAWYVQVLGMKGTNKLPYQLTFADPSVLGTSSLSVPGGGFSPYLQTVNLPGRFTKYTLSVTGISPADDPQIIIIDDGDRHEDFVPPKYVISWLSSDAENMTYTVTNGGHSDTYPLQPPPDALPLTAEDLVTFQVQPAAPFYVVFAQDPNHGPQTPFLGHPDNLIPGENSNGVESTDSLTVAHNQNPDDPIYQFHIALQDGSAQSIRFNLNVPK